MCSSTPLGGFIEALVESHWTVPARQVAGRMAGLPRPLKARHSFHAGPAPNQVTHGLPQCVVDPGLDAAGVQTIVVVLAAAVAATVAHVGDNHGPRGHGWTG